MQVRLFEGAALVVLAVLLAACSGRAPEQEEESVRTAAYVGRAVCADCHQQEVAAWAGSDHDRAMQPATSETVLGDFSGITFTRHGVTTRFFRRGDNFFVYTEGPGGRLDTFEVRYTFGHRPLQQYLVPLEGGRLQALTVAWDAEAQRWFSLYPDERIPPHDWLHWTQGAMNWNYMCADCHSTNLQKNYDLTTDTYQTTFAEIDVSCEACHGPGEVHVRWARAAAQGEAPSYEEDMRLTVDLSVQQKEVETCAPCHSRRRILDPEFRPGDRFLDHYAPELLHEGLYHADGQIQDEVYVYGSFLQSKMHAQGVRCSDCHDPHTTQLKVQGNALCTRCHAASTFDVPAHHHHEPGTAGAQCVDCHMPERTYMVVDPRRDHSFKVPRPDLTVELGVPNACNGCHTEWSPEWARDQVVDWYGPARQQEPHFAQAFAAARARQPEAASALTDIIEQEKQPAIVRATAVELLAEYPTRRTQEATRRALRDESPLVRAAAVRTVEARLPPEEVVRLVTELLEDTTRLVRTEAARALALTGRYRPGVQPEEHAAAFRRALEEYMQSQQAVSDQAGTHVNLAVVHEAIGITDEAEQAYRTALRLDSTFVPAHLNLAVLYNRQRLDAQQRGRHEEARVLQGRTEARLHDVLRHQAEQADAHYMLGLLLAEDAEQLEAAARHLAEAARLAPQHARMQYNAGLAYQHLGKPEAAERFLQAAYQLEPQQADYLNALSIFYVQQERWQEALHYTEELATLASETPAVQQRLRYIRQHL